jgi:polysaccharide pyruvyl transferase WcaK-like protein
LPKHIAAIMQNKNVKPKVGLLTLPQNGNYGGLLQAVALYKYLQDQNCAVDFIRLRKAPRRSKLKLFLENLLGYLPKQNIMNSRRQKLLTDDLNTLISSKSPEIETHEAFQQYIKSAELDLLIVGSDQVWRWEYITEKWRTFFFDVKTSARKIAYGASFGTSSLSPQSDRNAIKQLLSDFYKVSVREEAGLALCQLLGRPDAQWVLDPTFLVSKDFYLKLCKHAVSPRKKKFLAYLLDPAIKTERSVSVLAVVKSANRGVTVIGPSYNKNLGDFLASFAAADQVITDSYHGVIFSIIFEKTFVAINNTGRGSDRFTSLLTDLGLSDRILDGKTLNSEAISDVLFLRINYDEVNQRLTERKIISQEFLIECIDRLGGGHVDERSRIASK